MTEPTIQKRGYRIPISEEMQAYADGFPRKGHLEPVTPTPEQVAQHARAKAALEELEVNPYIHLGRMEDEPTLEPLVTERWVPDETAEEWLERYRAAKAAGDPMQNPISSWASTLAEQFQAVHSYGEAQVLTMPDAPKGAEK